VPVDGARVRQSLRTLFAMIEITWSLLGFALLLLYLAWRERVATNHRDARLLAGAATIAGLAGAAGAVVGVL
jgi:hypothetical protein